MRELAKYEDASGREVTLTDVDIKRVICDNPNVTDKEMKLFVELCKAQRLNPFVKEAYLVKYGGNPATMVVGKDVYTKRAQANPRFKGLQAGVFVVDGNGKGKEREGSMVLPGETPVGAWCKVYVDGYDVPIYDSVSFDEYAGKKRDGSLNSTWAGKPGTMIRKVAVVHALREAFPEDFQGLYDAAEMEQAMRPRRPRARPRQWRSPTSRRRASTPHLRRLAWRPQTRSRPPRGEPPTPCAPTASATGPTTGPRSRSSRSGWRSTQRTRRGSRRRPASTRRTDGRNRPLTRSWRTGG